MRGYWKRTLIASVVSAASATAFCADLKLFENGKSDYQIVVPDKPSAMAKKCVEELNYHIKEATGVTLPVVKESKRDKTRPAIILCTLPVNAAKYEQPNGFVIQVAGKNIHIFGDDMDGAGFVYLWRDDAFDKKKGGFTRYGTLFGVYEFLERTFGVRWLWPGKLGEYIPKTANAVWKDDTIIDQQKLLHSRIRYQPWRRNPKAWTNQKARGDFQRAVYVWILRNRMVRSVSMEYGHAYTTWFKKYGKTNPDLFNLLPNGHRRSDPYYCHGNPATVSMCVSSGELVKLKIRQWQEDRAKLPFVNLAENDTDAKCVCEACLALDVPNPTDKIDFAKRAENAAKRFLEKDPKWHRSLGSVTDRYCIFYNKVLAEAKKTDPNAKAVAYAYANYCKPPVKVKVSSGIIMEYVPRISYPWKTEERTVFREEWKKWHDAGASMFLRPNYTLDGHNFPVYYADELAEDFSFAWKNGLIGTDFDSLTGQFATQGLNLYVCARIHMKGYLSKDEIFSEYFRAFGPAEKEIREYHAYLKQIAKTAGNIKVKNFLGLNYAGYASHFLGMSAIYTENVLDRCMNLLDKASAKTKKDSTEYRRVEFLKNGIRHAKLNSRAAAEYIKFKKSGNIQPFANALNELDSYRASIEVDFGCDFGFLLGCENYAWNREAIKLQSTGIPLGSKWLIKFDPGKTGEKAGYFKPDCNTDGWTPIQVGKYYNSQEPNLSWIKKTGTDYTGVCWYKTAFRYIPRKGERNVKIAFGAVDEACKVYLNGKLLLDRPYPYKGDSKSWEKPFEIDITEHLKKDSKNDLTVMVINNNGPGGLFRPVYLKQEK